VAKITGGKYFRAYNTDDLQNIYELLDLLEPVEKELKSYRPIKALFYLPLTAASVIAALLALILYIPQLSFNNSFSMQDMVQPVNSSGNNSGDRS